MNQLTSAGITLLGVLLSVAATAAFGITADWWVRVLVGAGTFATLTVLVKLGTSSGRGPLARAADWIIGADRRRD